MAKQLLLILSLKWNILKRFSRQTPVFYSVCIGIMGGLLIYALYKLQVSITWKSLSLASILYILLCSRIQYSQNKQLLLKQYKDVLFLFLFTDFLLLTIPFYFIHIYVGIATCAIAFLYTIFLCKNRNTVRTRIVLPSPFFTKSSYLWHAKFRYTLPVIWLVMLVFIVVGYFNKNPNLAFVAFGGGTFVAFISTIFQSEKVDFVQMYADERLFMKHTLLETLINSVVFMLLPAITTLVLFPYKWKISLLILFCGVLININLLWIKYAFYPSLALSAVMFLVGLSALGALSVSLYGIVLVPVYYALLFYLCKKNIRQILTNNERTDY